jgi:hypothetical protein
MKRSTLILVVVLAILAVAAYLVMQRPGETSTSGPAGNMLVEYDSAAVDRLEVIASGGSITLEKEAGSWMLVSPLRYKADGAAVTAAIGQGRRLELSSLVSTNPGKQSLFLVDSTGTLVKVYAKGAVQAAFRVGKPSSSFTETYVRREGSDDVHLAQGILTGAFVRQPNEWRDKTVFSLDQPQITAVKFQFGDTTFTLALADSLWRIGKDSVAQTTVTTFLTALSSFKANEFIDSTVSPLPKPTALVEVAGTQIRFHWNKDGSWYYVQSSQSPQLFKVLSWKAAQILKRKTEFLPSGA